MRANAGGKPRSARARLAPAAVLLAVIAVALAGCGPGRSRLTELSPPGVARGPSATDPTVAIAPRDRGLLLAWLADDGIGWRLWFARSDDAGASWSTPVVVSPPGEPLAPAGESSPRLAGDAQGRVAIVWTTAGPTPALRFARSLDGGRTWSPPVSPGADRTAPTRAQGHHDMTSADSGHLLVAWLESPPAGDGAVVAPAATGGAVVVPAATGGAHDGAEAAGEHSVRIVRSMDFGGRWSADAPQAWQACPCCRMATGMSLVEMEFLALRRHQAGDIRDIGLTRPVGPPVRAFEDGWSAAECPAAGPALAVARDGTLRVAWYTGATGRAGVWFRQGIPETFDTTRTPLLVLGREAMPATHVSVGDAGRSGTLIACDADSSRSGGLLLARVEASGRRVVERLTVPGARGASRPQVAASNTNRRAYVVWTEREENRMRVRLKRWEVGR